MALITLRLTVKAHIGQPHRDVHGVIFTVSFVVVGDGATSIRCIGHKQQAGLVFFVPHVLRIQFYITRDLQSIGTKHSEGAVAV